MRETSTVAPGQMKSAEPAPMSHVVRRLEGCLIGARPGVHGRLGAGPLVLLQRAPQLARPEADGVERVTQGVRDDGEPTVARAEGGFELPAPFEFVR